MSARQQRNKGRSTKELPHVRIYHTMRKTAAWAGLSAYARAAYLELAARYRGPGSNNGRIPFSARDMAAAINVGKATAWRALNELQERGFIVETKRGAFSYKMRHATEWRLTEFPCDVSGHLPTRDYERWAEKNSGSTVKPNGASSETVRFPCETDATP